jgi:hypothetical protein
LRPSFFATWHAMSAFAIASLTLAVVPSSRAAPIDTVMR